MLKLFKYDLAKYKKYSDKSTIVLLLFQQGLWALLVYRINNGIYNSKIFKPIKLALLLIGVLWQKWIEIITGISLPYSAQIGKGFYIGHFGNIIINGKAIIGENCNISQGVTIGVSGRGKKRGVPLIKDNVYIGVNAVIVGNITIGTNAVIAANSLVVNDVDADSTYMGVPAVKVNNNNSEAYI
ncbi:serine acetyltransferase [Flavobacteriaceae bacterium R38]|nr:serine acetyltransferase [Flavobacteriaceae bacterium R38]